MIKNKWALSVAVVASGLTLSVVAPRPQAVAHVPAGLRQPVEVEPKILKDARVCAIQVLQNNDAKHGKAFLDVDDDFAGSYSYSINSTDSAKNKTRASFEVSKYGTFTIEVRKGMSNDQITDALTSGAFDNAGHVLLPIDKRLSYDPGLARNTKDEEITRTQADALLTSFQGCIALGLQ